MSMECNAIDLSYCEGEKVWKRVHKVEIFFDTEKERDDFEKAVNAGNVKIAIPARWENNHCTACGMMPMGDELWKHMDCEPPKMERFMDYCPSCGAPMENGGPHE